MGIPKIVHQIWIGPNKQPDIWMNTVKDFCSKFGYEYVLWDNYASDNFPLKNRKEYDLIPLMCGKADILRYEILYKFGGIYIDADSVILNPEKLHVLISEFNSDCGFGWSQPDKAVIANGVILSSVNSAFMKECIEVISTINVLASHPCVVTGPYMISDRFNKDREKFDIKLYDSSVFYPSGWWGTTTIDSHKTMKFPEESVMYQYGYSTNFLSDIIDGKHKSGKIPKLIFQQPFINRK